MSNSIFLSHNVYTKGRPVLDLVLIVNETVEGIGQIRNKRLLQVLIF